MRWKPLSKGIAMIAVLALLAQLAISFAPEKLFGETKVTAADKQTAADLSNLTGASTTAILKLKKSGLNWNEIAEELKHNTPKENTLDTGARSTLLAESGLGEAFLDELKKAGYNEEQIQEAKLQAERVIFQLEELTRETTANSIQPKVNRLVDESPQEKRQSMYIQLQSKFDEKKAISFLLQLQEKLGSSNAVLDEYLLSLQLDMDLEDYLKDKEQYEQDKERKKLGFTADELVTLDWIEKDMLNKLKNQTNDDSSEAESSNASSPKQPSSSPLQDKDSGLPELTKPEVQSVKPLNPTEQIRQEIEALNPNHR
ncbi:hypothetical protein [Gorillibacterium sp. CAU 1737]|uniref:hypothetical protein n=1 Tax=Gorillibacterium sp. CAU 1737 TaxID=3140362 RepID=UPI0032616DCB